MLTVSNLDVRYPGASRCVVQGVSLHVPQGACTGVVGESGSGKSTLARAIVGLVEPEAGTIEFADMELVGDNRRRSKRRSDLVQMVFQNPGTSMSPRMTVGRSLDEAVRLTRPRCSRVERRARVAELLESVGLPLAGFGERYPHELSGGQLQRIAIARALAREPRLIVADEPTSSLDVSVQSTILNVLQDLRETLGLTLLFISHDLAVTRFMSEELLVMENGRVVETGRLEDVVRRPSHPYTVSLLAAMPPDLDESTAPLRGDEETSQESPR